MPAPQLTPTLFASTHTPWSQTASGTQVVMPQSCGKHVDAAHFSPLPHAPQLAESVRVSTHVPPSPPHVLLAPEHTTPTHGFSVHVFGKQTELGSHTSPLQLRSKQAPFAEATAASARTTGAWARTSRG